MKKIIAISILAAAAAMMISCDKTEFQQSVAGSSELTFTAGIDNVETKTAIVSYSKLNWEANDEISINGVTFTGTPDASDASKAKFAKKSAEDSDPQRESGKYNAYYPASLLVDGVPTLPAVQKYNGASVAGVNPMYAQSDNESLSFKNICGLLEICIKGKKTVKSIQVFADNLGMSGPFTLDSDFNAVVSGDEGVTLDCGSGVKLTTRATKFYVALPAGTYENLTILATASDNNIAVVSTPKAEVKRNNIYIVSTDFEFMSPDYLAFIGDYAFPALDYFEDFDETVGVMEVYPLEVNKSFAVFFPGLTPNDEDGDVLDYFEASFSSATKTMSFTNETDSSEGAIWDFIGIDGLCKMNLFFGYWYDEDTYIKTMKFKVDSDSNLTMSTTPASSESDDLVFLDPCIVTEDGEDTGYSTGCLLLYDDTFYNIANLETKAMAKKMARASQVAPNRDFTLKKTRDIKKGTGAYVMR